MIAQCSEEQGFILAPIDLSLVKSIRQSMPLDCHRRYDIYPKMNSISLPSVSKKALEDSTEFRFGTFVVKGLQVFYQSDLCFAFTNIKCVLPGRILFNNLKIYNLDKKKHYKCFVLPLKIFHTWMIIYKSKFLISRCIFRN